jgi:hypothetical protein
MTSYQKLKSQIAKLESDMALLNNELDIVCLHPDSLSASIIVAGRKTRQDIKKAMAFGYGAGEVNTSGIINLIGQ